MKNLVKLLALLLACLMIVPLLVACGEDPVDSGNDNESVNKDDESESEEESETEDPGKADLPDIKWDGQIFNVLGNLNNVHPQFQNFEIVYDEENLGEGVNDAIFKRNSILETKYDVKITQALVENIRDALAETSVSGDALYDLTFQEIDKIGSNALEGLFFDMNKVKYIDFTKPYWNPNVNETVAVSDRVYFTSSDFSLRDKNRAYVLFYNPEMAQENDIPDIITTVREGKWTLDLMTEYADLVDADITGEGARSIYDDIYGFVTDSGNAFAALCYGTENMIIDRNAENEMVLAMNTERMISSIDKILKLYANKNVTYESNGNDWAASGVCWYAGRALFSIAFTHVLKTSMERCEFDFGIIPLPKYDEAQTNYYTMADIFCMLFAIPTSCRNSEFSGFMIEALSAESTDTSLYAYYDVACKTRYSYNPVNGEMLDLIFEGIRYDVANIYSVAGLFNLISDTIPHTGQNLFSSLYKRKETSALNKLESIKETLESFPY